MIQFLDHSPSGAIALDGSYDPVLVLVSCLIATLASFVGLMICERISAVGTFSRRLGWLLLGSAVMGFGVWSMHFIGMLAFVLPLPVTYDVSTTLISVIPAFLASAFVLHNIAQRHGRLWLYVLSGTLLGIGIGSMHYTGMAGMRTEAAMYYDPALFVLSILIAIVLGNAAIYAHLIGARLFRQARLIISSLAAAGIMGLAIAGMHYTAMAATSYYLPGEVASTEAMAHANHPAWLAAGVTLVAICITLSAVVATLMARKLQTSAQLLHHTQRQLIEASDAIEAMHDGFVLFDEEGRLLTCNSAYTAITGFSPEESLGKIPALIEAIHGDQGLYAEIQASIARQGSWQGEIWDRRKNGERYPAGLKISSVRPRDGKRRHFVVTLSDISERKAAEEQARAFQEALQQSEAQFRQIANGMPQLAWSANARGEPEWFNSRWYEYTGVTPGTMDLLQWPQFFHPDDRDKTLEGWRRSLNTGEIFTIEYRCRRHDGDWRWFLGSALPLRDGDGTIVRWFGTCTDIHDHKVAEAELRRANQELEEFAYVASHDLQEPLRKVAIYTQLLLDELGTHLTPETREHAGVIQSGVLRMQTLIQDLLVYSRTIHHSADLDSKVADLNASLADAIQSLNHQSGDLHTLIDADPLPRVRADQTQMSLVFQNLLSNALKYQQPDQQPRVRIRAQLADDHWLIQITDNGIGFAPEYSDKIFGLFKRLYKQEYPGTGLGLAICKRIIARYRGRIWAQSPGEGLGATFSIQLPVA